MATLNYTAEQLEDFNRFFQDVLIYGPEHAKLKVMYRKYKKLLDSAWEVDDAP